MADTWMTTEATERPAGLAGLWPFPGLFLLVVFGGWLFYMGYIAGMEDVATAFYGLGGVSALLLVLALRAVAVGRVRGRSAEPTATPRRRRHAGRAGVASVGAADDPFAVPRRSAIVDEGAAPAEGAIYPGLTPGSGMPLNPRVRARQEELRAAPLVDEDEEQDEAPREVRQIGPTDAAFETMDDKGDEAPETAAARPTLKAEPLAPRDDEGARLAELRATLRHLEARINRERADRGAQIAKLEGMVKSEAEALRAAMPGRVDGLEEDAAIPPGATDLADRLDALAARLAALEAQPATMDGGRGGDLDMAQPNAAANSQLLLQIEQMINERLATALHPSALRQSLGLSADAAPSAGGEGDGSLGERIAAAHGAIAAANEAAQAERAAIRTEIETLQRSVQRALGAVNAARRSVGDLPEGATIAEQLATLRAAVGDAGAATATTDAVEGRLAEIVREVDEVRGNLGAVIQHVARMGEHYQDLLARLDRIGDQFASESRSAAGGSPGVQGEVEALRDALTTIIEQNREIRAQQELLSARLESPRGREG